MGGLSSVSYDGDKLGGKMLWIISEGNEAINFKVNL